MIHHHTGVEMQVMERRQHTYRIQVFGYRCVDTGVLGSWVISN